MNPKQILEHHGIKGQKWGVTRSKEFLSRGKKKEVMDKKQATEAFNEQVAIVNGKSTGKPLKSVESFMGKKGSNVDVNKLGSRDSLNFVKANPNATLKVGHLLKMQEESKQKEYFMDNVYDTSKATKSLNDMKSGKKSYEEHNKLVSQEIKKFDKEYESYSKSKPSALDKYKNPQDVDGRQHATEAFNEQVAIVKGKETGKPLKSVESFMGQKSPDVDVNKLGSRDALNFVKANPNATLKVGHLMKMQEESKQKEYFMDNVYDTSKVTKSLNDMKSGKKSYEEHNKLVSQEIKKFDKEYESYSKSKPSALDKYKNPQSDDIKQNDNHILEHHGIKGQKWGVTRTDAQLGNNSSRDNLLRSAAREKASVAKYQDRGALDDKELEAAVKRMRLENEMHRLASDAAKMTDTRTAGQKFMDDVKTKAIKAATDQAQIQAEKLARKAIDEAVSQATGGLIKNAGNAVPGGRQNNNNQRQEQSRPSSPPPRQEQARPSSPPPRQEQARPSSPPPQSSPPPPPRQPEPSRSTSTSVVTSPPPGARSIDAILSDSRNNQTSGRFSQINDDINNRRY